MLTYIYRFSNSVEKAALLIKHVKHHRLVNTEYSMYYISYVQVAAALLNRSFLCYYICKQF